MTYQVGYLYQRSNDGRDWANGFGPLQDNLRVISNHDTRHEALEAGARAIGSPSPMGTIADAYLVRVTSRSTEVLGEIRADGTLDRGFARPKTRESGIMTYTEDEIREYIESTADDSNHDPETLRDMFVSVYEREPDADERRDLWSWVCSSVSHN